MYQSKEDRKGVELFNQLEEERTRFMGEVDRQIERDKSKDFVFPQIVNAAIPVIGIDMQKLMKDLQQTLRHNFYEKHGRVDAEGFTVFKKQKKYESFVLALNANDPLNWTRVDRFVTLYTKEKFAKEHPHSKLYDDVEENTLFIVEVSNDEANPSNSGEILFYHYAGACRGGTWPAKYTILKQK